MFTIPYKGCHIHGYFDRDNVKVQIGKDILPFKTMLGAKRFITSHNPGHPLASVPTNTLGTVKMNVIPIGKKATLASVVDQDKIEPHLLDNLGTYRFENQQFRIVKIDPREWFEQSKKGDKTIRELYTNFAKGWQKKLVKRYQRDAFKLSASSILVIDDDVLEDGFHRLVAFAQEELEVAYAIDLSQVATDEDIPLFDDGEMVF